MVTKMVRPVDAKRTMPRAALAAAALIATVVAGCGGDAGTFANRPRPPAQITVSVTVAPARVTASPAQFGAGPAELRISNQTARSQRVTLRSERLASGGSALEQTTGPINPGDTTSLAADLAEGRYALSVRASAIAAAKIAVGHARESAQDRVLQP